MSWFIGQRCQRSYEILEALEYLTGDHMRAAHGLKADSQSRFDSVFTSSHPSENQRVEIRGAIPAVGAVSGGKGLSGKRAR